MKTKSILLKEAARRLNINEETMDRKPNSEGVKVKVIGNVDKSGKTGIIVRSNKDGSFHVVEINGKEFSFQGSDLQPV